MNFKKMPKFIFCLILSAQFTFLLASCDFSNGTQTQTPNDDSTDGSNNDSTSDSTGTITDDNDVTITTPTTTTHNFELVSSNDVTYVYKCSDCDEEISTTISCESGTENASSVTNETITFSNLTSDTVYKISGEFYGNIVIDVGDDYKFELELNGFTLSSSTNCPISILSGDKVTLSAKKETINYVYYLREAIDESDENAISASVYSLCDLDIEGKGTLYVSSTNNNGIHTKDDLNIKNLTLQVECEDNALKGNDSVTIESGKITLISRSGDGIKTTNSDVSSKGNQRGIVKITGGEVVIYAACDGIDAAYDVQIDETNASVSL